MVSLVKNTLFYDAAEMKMTKPIPFAQVNRNKEIARGIVPGELKENLVFMMDEPYEEALKILGIPSYNIFDIAPQFVFENRPKQSLKSTKH
jgi:hypothetical protein